MSLLPVLSAVSAWPISDTARENFLRHPPRPEIAPPNSINSNTSKPRNAARSGNIYATVFFLTDQQDAKPSSLWSGFHNSTKHPPPFFLPELRDTPNQKQPKAHHRETHRDKPQFRTVKLSKFRDQPRFQTAISCQKQACHHLFLWASQGGQGSRSRRPSESQAANLGGSTVGATSLVIYWEFTMP